jgi:hypothetical protein
MGANPEHLFCVNIKIMMGYEVSKPNGALPIDLGILRQQSPPVILSMFFKASVGLDLRERV